MFSTFGGSVIGLKKLNYAFYIKDEVIIFNMGTIKLGCMHLRWSCFFFALGISAISLRKLSYGICIWDRVAIFNFYNPSRKVSTFKYPIVELGKWKTKLWNLHLGWSCYF